MHLVATIEEIEENAKLGILKLVSKDEYMIETRPDAFGKIHQIKVLVEHAAVQNKVLSVDAYLQQFPTIAESAKLLKLVSSKLSRNLRTGNKDKIQRKLLSLSKQFTPEEIAGAIKEEIELRVTQSNKTGRNELNYMQGAEAWCNNTANVEEMVELYRSNKAPEGERLDVKRTDNSDEFDLRDFNFY